jgi:hypothetical protein
MANNNLFSLPKVQTSSRLINQIQDNVRSQVAQGLQNAISASSAVGEVKGTTLTEAQLQDQLGGNWVVTDGRNVVGSKYQQLTGKNTIPTIAAVGDVTYFIRIN